MKVNNEFINYMDNKPKILGKEIKRNQSNFEDIDNQMKNTYQINTKNNYRHKLNKSNDFDSFIHEIQKNRNKSNISLISNSRINISKNQKSNKKPSPNKTISQPYQTYYSKTPVNHTLLKYAEKKAYLFNGSNKMKKTEKSMKSNHNPTESENETLNIDKNLKTTFDDLNNLKHIRQHSFFNEISKQKHSFDDDDKLSISSRKSLNKIKENLVALIDKQKNKKFILNELQSIYSELLQQYEENTKDFRISVLEAENKELKQIIKNIDNKFDVILKENIEIKSLILSKTEEYETNMNNILDKFVSEIRKNQDNNSVICNKSLKGENTEEMIILTDRSDSPRFRNIVRRNSNNSKNIFDELVIQDEEKSSVKKNLKLNDPNCNMSNSSFNDHNYQPVSINFKENSFKDSSFLNKLITESIQNNEKGSEMKAKLSLNLGKVETKNFNDEFLDKIEEFSPSWRDECQKLKGLHRK